jgi:hypothetical protein
MLSNSPYTSDVKLVWKNIDKGMTQCHDFVTKIVIHI